MSKVFEVIGYVASVLAAAFGIIWLINKLTDREIEEELADECDCECDEACDCECDCECAEEAPVAETADAEA